MAKESYVGEFYFRMSPLTRFLALFLGRAARGEMRKVQRNSMAALAMVAEHRIKEAYDAESTGHTEGTKQVYAQGKRLGGWPRRETHSGAKSLKRTGGLARFVSREDKGHTIIVGISPSATYSSHFGGDLADRVSPPGWTSRAPRPVWAKLVAEQMERPRPIQIAVTERMQAFLQLLQKGQAGGTGGGSSKGKRKSATRTGKTIVLTPRARPVWGPVGKDLPTAHPAFWKAFQKELRRIGWRSRRGTVRK